MNISCRELMPVIAGALKRGARVRMTTTGGSMRPFLREGDTVELEPVNTRPVRIGDVILARHSDELYLLHRVVRLENAQVTLQGDALAHCDAPVSCSALLGRVTAVEHGGRTYRLDRGFRRLAGILWLHLSPLGPLLLPLAGKARRVGRRIYCKGASA